MRKFTIIFILILLLISIILNLYLNNKIYNINNNRDTTFIEKIDTVRDTIPILKTEKQIKVIYDKLNHIDTIFQDGDTIFDTIQTVVEIPISQKEYSDDSTYTAWVSGYKANLDSINVYNRTITKIVKEKNKKWGVGPMIFGGYNVSSKQLDYGIGIGVTYNLFQW